MTPEMVVRVPMMVSENRYHYLLDGNLSCKVVGLPYQGNASALLILPSEDGMAQVESGLNENLLRKWLKLLTKRYSSDPAGQPEPPGLQGDTCPPRVTQQGEELTQPRSCSQAQRHYVKPQVLGPGPLGGSRAGSWVFWETC